MNGFCQQSCVKREGLSTRHISFTFAENNEHLIEDGMIQPVAPHVETLAMFFGEQMEMKKKIRKTRRARGHADCRQRSIPPLQSIQDYLLVN